MIITSFFKKILLFIVSAIFLIWPFFVSAEEPLWPQEDFDLVYPVYRMYTPDDPAPIDKDYKILFAFYPAAVRDGKLSNVSDGNYRTNISYRLGAQTFTGDGIIKLEGVYDKETGKISGNYKIDKSVSNTDKRGGGGWYRGTESGTFQGQVIKDHVVLNFFCKKNNGEWYYKFPNYKSSTGIEEKSGTETRCTYIVNKVSYMVVSIAKPQSAVSKLTDVESPKKHVDAGVRVAGMTGQVDIEIDGVRRPLKMDDVIPVDAHIITEEDSKVILSFVDMSTFVLGPESEIVVSSPPEKESKLKLVAGNIWANVKKMVKDGTMEIEMNQAVAGIKGTTFVCEEKNGKSILKVFEGEVDFKSKATGQSIKVKGGEKTEASTKELSKNESFDVSQEIESWLNLRNAEKINWEEGENKESPIVTKKQGLKKTESKTFNQYFLIGALSVILIIGMFIGAKFNKKLKVNKFLL